jgi:hypothetical protein
VFDSAGKGCSLEYWYDRMFPFMVRHGVYWGKVFLLLLRFEWLFDATCVIGGGFNARDSHHWELGFNAANGFMTYGMLFCLFVSLLVC